MAGGAREYLERWGELDRVALPWLQICKDVQSYVMPRRGMFVKDGQKPFQSRDTDQKHKIFDGTATNGVNILAAGMHGGLTSPSRPWFKLGFNDPGLLRMRENRAWLEECERRMYQALRRSNFYNVAHAIYLDQAAYGMGVGWVDEHVENVLAFFVFQPGEYRVAEGVEGTIDTLYRSYWQTPHSLAARFGRDNLSKTARKMLDDGLEEYIRVIHACQPNKNVESGRADSAGMAWESVYFEYDLGPEGDGPFLSKRGYREKPFFAPRWNVAGYGAYGDGPCFDALPDIKTLNAQAQAALTAAHMEINPPILAPDSLRGRLNKVVPGGVYYHAPGVMETVAPLYQVQPNYQYIEARMEAVRSNILKHLYYDLFLMAYDKNDMTATEASMRQQEKMLLLGPVTERNGHELCDPVIDRVFAIMERGGHFPQAPPDLRGQVINVEYVGLLAQAQRQAALGNVQRVVGFLQALMQTHPEAGDVLNVDKVVKDFADDAGMSVNAVRGDDETAALRQQRAQAQQRMQAFAEAQAAAKTGKDLGTTPTDGKNALTDVVSALEEQQGGEL